MQQAALARHQDSPEAKKLRRDATIAWLRQEVDKVEHPVAQGSGKTLQEKMELADIPSDVIDNAIRLRQQYRMEMLTPHYQELADRRATTREVAGMLHLLLSNFDAGKLGESGVAFHSLCLGEGSKSSGRRLTSTPSQTWSSCSAACTTLLTGVGTGCGGRRDEIRQESRQPTS